MDAASRYRFTKLIDPVSLFFGVRDLETSRFADEIEFRSRSHPQEHENADRYKR